MNPTPVFAGLFFWSSVRSAAPLPALFFGFNYFLPHFFIFIKVLVLWLFDNFNVLAGINPYFN